MDKGKYLLTAAVLALLIMAPTGGFIGFGDNGMPAAAETGMKPPGPSPHHPPGWGPEPGQVILDTPYPPPYRGWPPHYHQPGSPRYYHPWYPPYYEPETPWYEEAPPLPAGRLLLLVKPLPAEVTLNGYQLQRHPDLSFEVGLLPGEYQLKITAAGYKPLERKVRIRGGERLHLTISLEHDSEP